MCVGVGTILCGHTAVVYVRSVTYRCRGTGVRSQKFTMYRASRGAGARIGGLVLFTFRFSLFFFLTLSLLSIDVFVGPFRVP